MNYKKIIKSRKTRLAILKMLSFIPDKTMLKLQYRIKSDRKLNLKNPERYTEKIQWYKLNDKNPRMVECVDKADVRNFVASKGLSELLTVNYGVFDSADEIDFNGLPSQFVLKDTLGGGGLSVIVVKDKDRLDYERVRNQLSRWTSVDTNIRGGGREWPYRAGKKHRILIEEFLDQKSENAVIDYKVFCFDGEPFCTMTVHGGHLNEDIIVRRFYDNEWNNLEIGIAGKDPVKESEPQPENFKLMLDYARRLSEDFRHARVDFYNIEGKIYFGELTFFSWSGYAEFRPDSFDKVLGEKFRIE